MPDRLAELQPIFRDILDQPNLVLTRESNARNVANWDSLSHIELVTSIREHYNIKFALGELRELENVGDMIDLIEEKLARNAARNA